MQAVWCWVNPGGHLQVKPPIVLTQRNWQLCCFVAHSSRSKKTKKTSLAYVPCGGSDSSAGLREKWLQTNNESNKAFWIYVSLSTLASSSSHVKPHMQWMRLWSYTSVRANVGLQTPLSSVGKMLLYNKCLLSLQSINGKSPSSWEAVADCKIQFCAEACYYSKRNI